MSRIITEKQHNTLLFINEFTEQNGYPPTMRDLAAGLEGGCSLKNAQDHVKACARKGYLKYTKETARSSSLTALGRAAIGQTPDQNIPLHETLRRLPEMTLKVPKPGMFGEGKKMFALRMPDEAMTNAAIRRGDILVFAEARHGIEQAVIVACELMHQTYIRFYFQDRDRVVLRPSNPLFPDLYPGVHGDDEFAIRGRLKGVIRSYVE